MPTLTLADQLADLRDALLEIADHVVPLTPTHVRLREIAMKLDTLAKTS